MRVLLINFIKLDGDSSIFTNKKVLLLTLFFSPCLLFSQQEVVVIKTRKSEYKETVYAVVDEEPEFPEGEDGLLKFLKDNSKYPIIKRENGVAGKSVYVKFIIDERGSVWQYKIVRGQNEKLDAETIRLVEKMPLWKSGIKDGVPVKTSQTLEIRYAIECD